MTVGKKLLLQTRIDAAHSEKLAARRVALGDLSEAAYLRLLVLRDLGIASKK